MDLWIFAVLMIMMALKTGKGILFSDDNSLKQKLKEGIEGHVNEIVSELGVMKGSLMKAGQMLSLYADAFLPPEAKKVLASLQNDSSFLDWELIAPVRAWAILSTD